MVSLIRINIASSDALTDKKNKAVGGGMEANANQIPEQRL